MFTFQHFFLPQGTCEPRTQINMGRKPRNAKLQNHSILKPTTQWVQKKVCKPKKFAKIVSRQFFKRIFHFSTLWDFFWISLRDFCASFSPKIWSEDVIAQLANIRGSYCSGSSKISEPCDTTTFPIKNIFLWITSKTSYCELQNP